VKQYWQPFKQHLSLVIEKVDLLFLGLVLGLWIFTWSLTLNSRWLKVFQSEVLTQNEILLSTVQGPLFGPNEYGYANKVQVPDGLRLEIFRTSESGYSRLIKAISFKHAKDAHIEFLEGASNLVLVDEDGDGSLEILFPYTDSLLNSQIETLNFANLEK